MNLNYQDKYTMYVPNPYRFLQINPLSYYRFDGNVNDELNLNSATFTQNILYNTGIVGQRGVFQGNPVSYAAIPNNGTLSFTNGVVDKPFSLSGWLQETASRPQGYVFCKTLTSVNFEYILTFTSGVLQFTLYSNTSPSNYIRIRILGYGTTLRHFVITYDGSGLATGLNAYVNGVKLTLVGDIRVEYVTLGTYVCMSQTASDVLFGQNGFSRAATTTPFYGNIDGFAIWDKELTQSEAEFIYTLQTTSDII